MGMDRKIEKKKWPIWKIGLIVVLLGGAGLLMSAIYRSSTVSRLNVEQDRILTDTIHSGVFKEFITIFGRVEPLKTVFIDAVETGKVERFLRKMGV